MGVREDRSAGDRETRCGGAALSLRAREGGRAVTGAEGGRVTVNLSDEYRVAYDVETVQDQSVRLRHFVLQRVTRDADGKDRIQDVYAADVVLPVGRMLMIGAAQNPESKRALFLTLQARPR